MVNTNVIQNILQGNTNIHNGPKNKNDQKKNFDFFFNQRLYIFSQKNSFCNYECSLGYAGQIEPNKYWCCSHDTICIFMKCSILFYWH